MLLQGKICLAVTARDYRDMERQSLRDKSFNPRAIPIAYDGLALIVNKANNDTCISVKDFAAIMSGKITQWKQLNPKSDKGEVLIVFDNKKSSTVHFVEDSILGGKPITNPNMAATNNTADEGRTSSYFVENGSYLKLRTLQLGYNLPASLLKKLLMSKARVYVSGQNLLTIKSSGLTCSDPENPNWNYPLPTSVSFGLQIGF